MTEFQACDASLLDAIVTMMDWHDGGRIVEEPGMLFAVSQSRFPTPYTNTALALDDHIDPERLAARAGEIFHDRRHILWGRGAEGGAVGALCRQRGYIDLGVQPAMVIEDRVPARAAPRVDVSRARDLAAFAEFVEVSKCAYLEAGLPPEIADRLLAKGEAALGSAVIAVAHLDGKPAAAALSITNAASGVGGVYWVGTVPDARRRGAADAVTRFVTNAAFDDGATIVTLQASAAGEPVYLRMGYREVGRYARYLSPKPGELTPAAGSN